ncbi:FAD-dependent oxidoreductase [Roseofilum sp. BLCC_M154]|uniref:FAD-dependent oxidoreductase n=1 Tax=Roseofilum acuticapitatum BLCC-M154 TaxID=3022444 RepID=A0ABT7AMJ0_9CYAN|nr:NAD(P)-binding protein [Roseofilum acuticapitatum]MDJ1168118.1 FAD-dependent oxidoreductase [Roseofilum acuticapitatum BLCC-M154]
MLDYLIIGGGITGVTIARLLQLQGEKSFLVLEAESEPGGLCRTHKVKNHYLDIGGGHFLCTKYPQVYDFIFSHIGKDQFNYYPRVSKVRIHKEILDYPIESNLWQLSIEKQIDYVISVISSGEASGNIEPHNYEEWIHWKLGDMIAENYMLPYNQKIWGVMPEEMDIDWLHKIPRINTKEILKSCLIKNSNKSFMPSHQGFYYPKKGGFQEIFNSIYKFISEKVLLTQPVNKLDFLDNYWVINNEYKAKVVINTAPWPLLYQALDCPSELIDAFDRLQYNSIVVSLWEQEYNHDWHWCYDPSLEKEFHREFYINNFAPHSQNNGMYTETNLKRWPGIGKSWNNGKQPIYEYNNELAYPIPVLGHSKAIQKILSVYKSQNMFGVGRWGQWQYFNSDVCIWEAMKFVDFLTGSSFSV